MAANAYVDDSNAQSVARVSAIPPNHDEDYSDLAPRKVEFPSTAQLTMPQNAMPTNVVAEHKEEMFAPTPYVATTAAPRALPTDLYKHEAFRARLWRAYKGASLYEVAKVWCDEADVALIWNAPKSMALKETISARSPFVEVVEQLLEQYDDAPYNLRGIMSVSETHNKPQLIVISQ